MALYMGIVRLLRSQLTKGEWLLRNSNWKPLAYFAKQTEFFSINKVKRKTWQEHGPVPSRRLGISLGVSPIPKKTCNYSWHLLSTGKDGPFHEYAGNIFSCCSVDVFESLRVRVPFDVVTIVGEGEPTLYLGAW